MLKEPSRKRHLLARDPAAKRMFSVRKRSAKAKRQQQYFVCAKAKRQQQYFVCAKVKRQQQCFNCAKAKRQLQSASRNGNQPLALRKSHTLFRLSLITRRRLRS
ncbi:hypothetical protein AMS59_23230 [Lysinibacillus sp. FJAT-14745]|nr:hypothetical protein AMS59_23230 [Lysinibacillus sp. FJAT-14745]